MTENIYHQEQYRIDTLGRSSIEISQRLHAAVDSAGVLNGLCHVFIHHTSASLMICENAASEVRDDLESFFSQLILDGDPLFSHTDEGADDMPAHIRSVLTQTELSIPIIAGRLALGTWQGVYLWEHRTSPHLRDISITIHGLGG
ncbi:MAG: secondary thiamine-phosphate synthase enzyme YjbQ [Gammaproteobacteria bacterium]|nr:secondary thiamine-phosphate synthase enzyme YjbQ [Gammaproteobacteria bacterium]